MVLYWRRYGRVGGCQNFGGIAQLGERLPCKQEVTSSNLVISIRGEMNATKAFVALRMYLENCIQIDKNIKTSEVIVITNNN